MKSDPLSTLRQIAQLSTTAGGAVCAVRLAKEAVATADAAPKAPTATTPKIRRIVVILETSGRRGPVYYGFRYTDTATGITVEAQTSGGESNILHALTFDPTPGGGGWLSDYYRETVQVTEKHLFALPVAGCTPAEIRKWVADTTDALLLKRTAEKADAATNPPTV